MKNQKSSIHHLYEQLGLTIADIIAHPSCPPVIYNQLTSLVVNAENHMPNHARPIAMARGTFVDALVLLTEPTAVPERRKKAARS